MEDNFGIERVGERWRTLASGQKISAGILAVCAAVALGLSVNRLHARVRDPFTVSKADIEEARRAVGAIDVAGKELDEAKRRDTDGDGLSDYDEENILGTSPFLADTDGDKIPDNTELALGMSPNCPKGSTCTGPKLDTSSLAGRVGLFGKTVEDIGDTGDEFFAEYQRGVNEKKAVIREETGSTSTELNPVIVRDPDDIRRILKESGEVDPELVDRLTDEELLQIYDEAFALAAQETQDEAAATQ